MKLTIIPFDKAVYVDGVSFSGLDFSACQIPSNVHALQFNDAVNYGWIEFAMDDYGNRPDNQPISELPAWALTAKAKWDSEKENQDYIAAHPPTPDSGQIPVTTI